MSKRILQVFGSLNMGGAETRMMYVYNYIDRNKYSFDFLTMQTDHQYFEKQILDKGGKIFKIPAPRESGTISNIKNIYRIIKENGPYDAVHAHTSHHCGIVMLAAWLAGVKVRIAHSRTTGSKHNSVASKVMLWIGRFLIAIFATNRLAVSKNAAEYLFGKSYEKRSGMILPNALDLELYKSLDCSKIEAIKNEFGLNDSYPIIGHVGRFESMKNHSFLVDVFSVFNKKYPNSKLVLIGDGSLRDKTAEKVKALGLEKNVIFTGIRSDVHVFMSIFDVVVIPSVFEGLCGAVIEGQASGKPVVVSTGITVDTDMGLDLVSFLSLDESTEAWADKIADVIDCKKPDREQIEKCFEKRGLSLSSEIEILKKIYSGKA